MYVQELSPISNLSPNMTHINVFLTFDTDFDDRVRMSF